MEISAEYSLQANMGNTKKPYWLQATDSLLNDYCNVFIYKPKYPVKTQSFKSILPMVS